MENIIVMLKENICMTIRDVLELKCYSNFLLQNYQETVINAKMHFCSFDSELHRMNVLLSEIVNQSNQDFNLKLQFYLYKKENEKIYFFAEKSYVFRTDYCDKMMHDNRFAFCQESILQGVMHKLI